MSPDPPVEPKPERANVLRAAAIVVLAAVALGLVSAARMLLLYRDIGVIDALWSGLLDWGSWIPFVPLVFLARRRLPLAGARGPLRFIAHAGLSLGVSFAQVLSFALISSVLRETRLRDELHSSTLVKLHAGAFVYWAILLGLEALAAQRRAREEATRRAEAARGLAEARFVALEGHLRPHFLFNTLNSIAAVTRSDPDLAEAMITKLGALLRRTIDAGHAETPLADEVEFVRDYIDIERVRFGERLGVEYDVPEECAGALVPRLVLQPIVENAVRHGVASRIGGGTISVGAERADGWVRVRVSDDGAGEDHIRHDDGPGEERPGFALAAIRERLAALYGDRGGLELRERSGGGTLVELCIPFHTEAV